MSQQPSGGWTPAPSSDASSPAGPERTAGVGSEAPGPHGTTDASTGRPGPPPGGDDSGGDFSLVKAFGGWGGLLDAGLPGIAFLIAFSVSGRDLQLALIVSLAFGGALTVVRLVRRDPLQNVIGGFLGLALAAWIANRTGEAEDFYLPGLVINAGYALGYMVANLLRWPPIGLVVGLAAGWGLAWRKDPVLVRAFVRAGWLWVGLFTLRLIVQLPLYLAGEVEALGIAKIVMGWPLFLVLMWLTYVVIKASVPREKWSQVKQAADTLSKRRPGNQG